MRRHEKMTDEDATEYTTDRGITLYVYRGTDGHRRASLRGDDGQRIELAFADVPRLIHTLQWAMDDARKAEDERRAARIGGA
jgi:hypothetical protein